MGPREVLNGIVIILSGAFYEVNIGLSPLHAGFEKFSDFWGNILPWLTLAGIIGYDIFYLKKNWKKQDVFLMSVIWVIIQGAVILSFWLFPNVVASIIHQEKFAPTIRWVLFGIIFLITVRFYGHEHGERRWLYSVVGHLGALLIGWHMHRWAGILFFSLPLLLAYYLLLYILAKVTLPASDPDDKHEKWMRFLVLVSYTWGMQFPIRVVADHAWKPAEVRISGDFARDLPFPGLVWTKSHHIVGITGGTQFNRVDGPGVIFTGKLEQPFQIIDLRIQLRNNEIDVVSKDGIKFIVRVFTAFRLDPEAWDKETHAEISKRNPLLQGADKPSYTTGSFPFSHQRAQAAMSTPRSWDKWALNIINEEARKIVSQKTLDEFWRPKEDSEKVNAMDSIAKEIKDKSELTLRSKGILLVASRIVNFRFPKTDTKDESKEGGDKEKEDKKKDPMDEISRQQVNLWIAEWEHKREKELGDAKAESEKQQQEARIQAEASLLDSIADALREVHEMDPKLPKHVVALRYLSALQDYAHKNTAEEEQKIKDWHNAMMLDQ